MKTRNRLISFVLTLALLCPVLTFMLPLEANAALVPDDGTSTVSSTNYLYEEWNFDDLTAGATVTKGYIDSHSNGYLGAASIYSEHFVAAAEGDNTYIRSNGIFGHLVLDDPNLMLLKNTYEISFDLRVESGTDQNGLFSWFNEENADKGYQLLRFNSGATTNQLGYRTGTTGGTYAYSVSDVAKWNNYRIRVNPVNGFVQVWVNGEFAFSFTNTNLKDNSASAEYSAIRIWYQWNNSGTPSHVVDIDNVKVTTNITIDEHLTFDLPEVDAATGSWDFTDSKVENGEGITATKGSSTSYVADPTDSTNTVLCVSDDNESGEVYGPLLTFDEPWNTFKKVELSFRVYYEGDDNPEAGWSNLVRFLYSGTSTYKVLFRVPIVKTDSGYNSTVSLNYRNSASDTKNDRATGLTLNVEAWNTVNVVVTPATGAVTVTVNNGTPFNFTNTAIRDVYNSGMTIKIMPYYHTNMNGKAYVDDVSVKTEIVDHVSPTGVVANEWNDPSFSMITPALSGMDIDDWAVTSDPALTPVKADWDFNVSTMPAVSGMTVSVGGDWEFKKISAETDDSVDMAWASVRGTSNNTVEFPSITLPGTTKDYETITVSWDMKYIYTSSLVNVFCIYKQDGTTNYNRIFRTKSMAESSGSTADVRFYADGGTKLGTMTYDTWHTFTVTITPATGEVVVKIDNGDAQTVTDLTNYGGDLKSFIQGLYENEKPFEFRLYRHSGMTGEAYIDNVSVSTTYSESFYNSLGYSSNGVLKTLEDADGNKRSTLAIQDSEKYLTNQPFEISFDYRMNQLPSAWINLLRFNMNGTNFSVLRLNNVGGIRNYTNGGDNATPNVSGSKTLAVDKWYNFRVMLDPTTGHCMVYLDNELVSDYNINEYYTAKSVFDSPTQMIMEIGAQSATSIEQDWCIDNVRIRTLDKKILTKNEYSDADFDSLTVGALDANAFANASGLYAKSLSGITVEGGELGKYLYASVSEGNGIDVVMGNGYYAPLASSVMSVEGAYTLKELGTAGTLDLLSLKRGDTESLSVLSMDGEGNLYIGNSETACYTLQKDDPTRIKTVISGITGQVALYVGGVLKAEGALIGLSSTTDLSYTDGMGNKIYAGTDVFASYPVLDGETQIKTNSGVQLYYSESPDYAKAPYTEDILSMFSPVGEGTWGIALDDLKVTRDESASVYYSADMGAWGSGFELGNSVLTGRTFVIETTAAVESTALVPIISWTLGTSATPLIYADADGYLYKADGTTKLSDEALLVGECKIALAVSSNYWEAKASASDRVISITAYANGTALGSYTVTGIKGLISGGFVFGSSDTTVTSSSFKGTRLYFGSTLRDFAGGTDTSGVKFEGYNAITIDFEDANFFTEAEANAIDYVDWKYSALGTTLTDNNGATVTISQKVTEGDNSFFRIRRPSYGGEKTNKPDAYMDYNLGALGDYGKLYSIEMDIKYTDTLGHSMNVAELFARNLTGSTVLLSILGTNDNYSNAYYFENDGIRYFLCDASGKLLKANPAGDGEFSEIGLVINETEGYYSIWIDGQNAYYHVDGGMSGEVVSTYKVPLEYEEQESASVCDPVARLLRATDNDGSNSIIDIDNISIDVIKNGMAPVLYGEQVLNIGGAVRFVATVDTLYANEVGFEIIAESDLPESGTTDKSSSIVFSSIKESDGSDSNVIYAENIGGRYIAVMSVTDLKVANYTFTVKPYVYLFGEKVYGTEKTITYNYAGDTDDTNGGETE